MHYALQLSVASQYLFESRDVTCGEVVTSNGVFKMAAIESEIYSLVQV